MYGEQSRKFCVKCRHNGELSDGRRALPAIESPHPLLHIGGKPPVCSNDTRLGNGPELTFDCLPHWYFL